MSQQPDNILAVLDLGSARFRVLVAEIHEGALRYRGHGIANAAGMRKGMVADLKPAAAAINRAAVMAEEAAETTIERCVVAVGGPHIRGVNSRGGISLGARLREITREDVRAAVDRARSISLPSDREVLHLLPREFILDEQPGILDAVGMVGNRLEVNLHIATSSASAQQSIVTCANRAGIEVTETVFEGIAAAEATLSANEREMGVCLLDVGAATSELVVFFEGSVAHTSVVPIGGDHFTNDLAVGLRVTPPEAEWLKCNYGHATVTAISQTSEVELTGLPGYEPRMVRQRLISEILEPRARELFQMLRDNLRQGGVLEALGAG
ncbi:MAG: cell division protein FtsA, partial [Acidobacteriaceae bacterium]